MAYKITPKTALTISACLLVITSTAVGKTIYVDDDAAGANNGSSWADAYNFLQDALADANLAEKPVEIRVAEGVYTPDSNSTVPDGTGYREATFRLINGVTLKGGYAGFGQPDFAEVDPNTRDIEAYTTVLSGDLNADDVDVNDPEDIEGEPTRSENSYRVVTGSGTDGTAVLDGLTLSGGNTHYGGGGMYNENGSPTVANCIFTSNNRSGMRNNSSSPTVTSCTFTGNLRGMHNLRSNPIMTDCTFSGNGRGMDNSQASPTLTNCTFIDNSWAGMSNDESNPTLTNCEFIRNSEQYGGGMFNEDSSPTLISCTFSQNSADEDGGGMYNDHSTPNVLDCAFVRNTAARFGGGMSSEGGNPTLTNCTFSGNSAEHGAGMYNTGSSPTISRCAFAGNEASGNGGALVDIGYKESTVLSQCTFTGNAAEYGGAIWIDEQSSIVGNCTFSGNVARQHGGAVYCWDASVMTMANCILWDNSPTEVAIGPYSTTPQIYYADIKGGWTGRGQNNISADPRFVNPGYWDTNGTPQDANDDLWVDGDYHLKSQAGRWDPAAADWIEDDVTSPCIDAGDPTSAIGHEPFPNGGIVNMGAYGGTTEASKSYFGLPVCETIVAGDINGDCVVDFKDFALLALHWLTDNTP